MKYLDKSITEINELLKAGTIKPIDLVEEAFENIEKNKELNAYITLCKDEAIAKAKELEGKPVDNLLFGLPIAVKDNIVIKGVRTTCASHILENFVPIYTATLSLFSALSCIWMYCIRNGVLLSKVCHKLYG